MKRLNKIWKLCLEYKFFFCILFLSDLLFAFCLWLMDAKAFWVLVGIFGIVVLGLFGVVVLVLYQREERKEQAVMEFLEATDLQQELHTLALLPVREQEQLKLIGRKIRECETAIQQQQQMREDYEEYIETWAHEIKVPLSLMTLLLDNRREEMSPLLYQRMVYVKGQIQEYVTQILYYARLKADHKDYRFERVNLGECIEEIISQYEPVLEEEQIQINRKPYNISVVTDRKGLLFLLEQAINNACKYMDSDKAEKKIFISAFADVKKNKICLLIQDNGIGVKPADLPFLFDKGFTGDTDERKRKATGMGLYLAAQMAQQLNIELSVQSEYGAGFELALWFPVVD